MTGRYSILIFSLLVASSTLLSARAGRGQELDPRKVLVSLSAQNQPLNEVFRDIEKKTAFRFFYNASSFNASQSVSIQAVNTPVAHVLERLEAETGLEFKQINNYFSVRPRRAAQLSSIPRETVQAGVPRVAAGTPAAIPGLPEDTTFTGRVTDPEGNPLVGVTVKVQGTALGAVTNASGSYTLQAPSGSTLVFSYVGYDEKTVQLNGAMPATVVMNLSTSGLNEVVVIGYETKQKKDLTGAVSVINSNDIKDIPVGGVDQIMQGKAAGVAVTEQTGAPGDAIAVRIRGVGTINDNDPLYIIDGVPTTDGINEIAPGDIESINVLKDASSAAIYGARASNGVVIITTKKGKPGKARLSFSNYTGVQTPGHLIKMANTAQYVKAFNQAATVDGRSLIPASMADTLPDVNWLKATLNPALITNTQLSVSGGNENSQFIVSANYFKQDGQIDNSSYNRFNIRTGVTSELSKYFKIGSNINLSYSKKRVVGTSGDGYGAGNPGASVIRYALFRTPATPVRSADGQFVDLPNPADLFGDGYNPVAYADATDDNFNYYTLLGDTYLAFTPVKNLTLKSDIGVNLIFTFYKQFFRTWGVDRHINSPNSLAQSTTNELNYNWTNTATYKIALGGKNTLTLLAGTEAIKDVVKELSASRQNYVNQDPDFQFMDNGLSNPLNGGNEAHWGLFSLFGRVGYEYGSKYLLNFNVRRDGSSRLSPGNQYGDFFSGSAGWRLDQEKFIQRIRQISMLKLRVSVGQLGNQNIGNYPYASIISGGYYYPFGGVSTEGYTITSKGNPDVKWETSTQTDIGLDLGLFKDALQVTADYFIKNTSHMLLSIPEPSSAGSAGSPTENAGKVRNSGLELDVTYNHRINKKASYQVTGNFATLHNEVLSLAGGKPIPGGRIDNNYYATMTTVGQPIGAFYLLKDQGIFQTPLDVITHAYQGPNIQPGDVKFEDVNGDGVIDQNDRSFVGSPIPKFTYGLTGDVNYGAFDLSVFFQGVYGNKLYNQVLTDIEGFYRPFNITERIATKSWDGPGTSNKFPRLSWQGATNNKQPSTRFLESGSYLRLKNIQIGYSFGNALLSRLKVTSVRFFVSAQNVFTVTKYTGLDPEMYLNNNSLSDGVRAVGIDWGTYPSARTYTAGVNINF